MFSVEHQVPDVYVQESRDFQLFSRLYDLCLQSSRLSINSMKHVSDTLLCNDTILPLVATKVGFFANLNLTDDISRKILATFPYILRYKGSIQAIQLVINLFERVVDTRINVSISEDKSVITLILPKRSSREDLLHALLEYVRPCGAFIEYMIRVEESLEVETYELNSEISVTIEDANADLLKSDLKENDKYRGRAGFTQSVSSENPKGSSSTNKEES